MRSLSFGAYCGIDELPVEVLNLFTPLVINRDKKIEFASEIISSGLQGNIDFKKDFNIDAFEASIRRNTKLTLENDKKRLSFIDFGGNSGDYSEVASNGGVREDRLNLSNVEKIKDAFEELLDDEELAYAVGSIKAMNDDIIISEQVDLIKALKSAKLGIPNAVDVLANLCGRNQVVADLVRIVLESKRELEELFA